MLLVLYFGVNWIRLAGDANGEFEHGYEPLGSIKEAGYCLTS
jgi:hypothetical protein